MKRTYVNRLPKGENGTVKNARIENGQLIVEVEFEKKFEPKDGDILFVKGHISTAVFIYKHTSIEGYFGCYFAIQIFDDGVELWNNYEEKYSSKKCCRYATEQEKSAFLERLEKQYHKRWDPEMKQLEDIRWIPKEGETYWYVGAFMKVFQTGYNSKYDRDVKRVEICNCFKTEEAAQKVADQIKEIFKNSKAE